MPGIDVRMMSYGDRVPAQDRYNSEESLEDNQSTTSSTESRQSDFNKKEHEFIPTRSSGILASKPAANPAQFTRINSNPLLISAQKQMLLVEEVKKKKKEIKVGDDVPDWQSNLDGWKMRRRKQSEEAIVRVSEIKRIGDQNFDNSNGTRKQSIGKKISLQLHNDDEIDFDELGLESEDNFQSEELPVSGNTQTFDTADTPGVENTALMGNTPTPRSSITNGSRRESRGISEEKVILEEPEEEEECKPVNPTKHVSNSPYDSAIEGYRSFAKSHINSQEQSNTNVKSESVITKSESQSKISLSKDSSVSRSASSSSLSFSSSSPGPSSLTKVQDAEKSSASKYEDEWGEKIETFVQPARRVSTEISDKMKQKLASFQESNSSKETTPVRNIKPDNKFKDKLNAFKNIETAVNDPPPPKPRRESEPNIQTRPKGMPAYRSSSSSFMNTLQNNKFFQENSLGSENDEETSLPNNQLVDDALEESFNVLEDSKDEPKDNVVFSADDFLPMTGKMAPPQEKPPPLPANPPPDLVDRKSSEEENEIDKQEREIIESLEREEKEHKKYLESISSVSGSTEITTTTTTAIRTNNSSFSTDTHQTNNTTVSHQTQGTQSQTTINKAWPPQNNKASSPAVNGDVPKNNKGSALQTRSIGASTVPPPSVEKQLREEQVNMVEPPNLHPKKKEKSEVKDYSKHWLIQEAEQRRISEAKQKQNLNIQNGQIEKIENINNNNVAEFQTSYSEKRVHNISDNIYANVDPANLNYNHNHSAPYVPEPAGSIPQIPGPQVPPRLGEGQDRVLSVSGKKKCSHCKDELGRGAAMIIESLRLFYHIRCFKCCVCSIQLGNGETGTDVRVRNNRLHCQNCYSNDEGLKFSKV